MVYCYCKSLQFKHDKSDNEFSSFVGERKFIGEGQFVEA